MLIAAAPQSCLQLEIVRAGSLGLAGVRVNKVALFGDMVVFWRRVWILRRHLALSKPAGVEMVLMRAIEVRRARARVV